jgi:hypothetical protein
MNLEGNINEDILNFGGETSLSASTWKMEKAVGE